jgi:phosphohistidine phosphatase
MMKVYLVRHGDALSPSVDPARGLSALGFKQVEQVGQVLSRKKVKVDRIESSHKKRAIETAEGMGAILCAKDLVFQRPGLKPDDSQEAVLDDLRTAGEDRMLVGHLPYMEIMAHRLLGESIIRSDLYFSPATVMCLSGDMGGGFKLDWVVRPEEL